MKTVTLYHWHNLQAVQGSSEERGFSLDYCGNYGFVDCDQGAEYVLPDGYELAESNAGTLEFYDDEGRICELGGLKTPVLYGGSSSKTVTLSQVK